MFHSRRIGPLALRVHEDWENVLVGPAGLRLDEWIDSGAAQVIKVGAGRTIYRVDLPGKTFFVKQHRRRLADMLRSLLRFSASRREWKKTVEAVRRQVPTVAPLAFGETRQAGIVGEHFLVTDGIADGVSLVQYFTRVLPQRPPREQFRIRRRLISALAALLAASDLAGLTHNDLHTGNVLVRVDREGLPIAGPDGRVLLYLMDMPGVRFSQPLDWRKSVRGLAMLLSEARDQTTRTERMHFWLTYQRARGDLSSQDARRWLPAIESVAWRHSLQIVRNRDKRALQNNRDFIKLRTREGLGLSVADLPREALAAMLHAPEELMRANLNSPVKLSHSSVVVEARLHTTDGTVKVAYKRARAKSLWKSWLSGLRPSRSRTGWYLGHALLSRGIATARPLVFCEPTAWPRRDSFLATQWIDGALNLHLYAWQVAALDTAERRKKILRCAPVLGKLIARMHNFEIAHRDLKWGNLAVVDDDKGMRVYLIDLDGVRMRRRLSPSTRADNLARLAASMRLHPRIGHTACLAFLKSYVRERNCGEDWKALWRRVSARLARPRVRTPDRPAG